MTRTELLKQLEKRMDGYYPAVGNTSAVVPKPFLRACYEQIERDGELEKEIEASMEEINNLRHDLDMVGRETQ